MQILIVSFFFCVRILLLTEYNNVSPALFKHKLYNKFNFQCYFMFLSKVLANSAIYCSCLFTFFSKTNHLKKKDFIQKCFSKFFGIVGYNKGVFSYFFGNK